MSVALYEGMRIGLPALCISLLISSTSFAAIPKFQSPIPGHCLTDYYHVRAHIPKPGASKFHKADDLRASCGTPVKAAADGRVAYAHWNKGYGWQVEIDHGNGIRTRYSHLSKFNVKAGQPVTAGQQIAVSGHSTSIKGGLPCHLHFELLKNGNKIDPEPYFKFPFCPGHGPRKSGGAFINK